MTNFYRYFQLEVVSLSFTKPYDRLSQLRCKESDDKANSQHEVKSLDCCRLFYMVEDSDSVICLLTFRTP